jgi:hypothetical protein
VLISICVGKLRDRGGDVGGSATVQPDVGPHFLLPRGRGQVEGWWGWGPAAALPASGRSPPRCTLQLRSTLAAAVVYSCIWLGRHVCLQSQDQECFPARAWADLFTKRVVVASAPKLSCPPSLLPHPCRIYAQGSKLPSYTQGTNSWRRGHRK